MALARYPSTFERETWFETACTVLSVYETGVQAVVRESQASWETKRKLHLGKLAHALALLNTASDNGAATLLRALYTNHPPKCATHTLLEPIAGHEKARLRKAQLHYHPDKNTGYDAEWKVLCEEVTKLINARYKVYRGDSM